MSQKPLPEIPGSATLWRTDQLKEAGLTSRAIEHQIQAGELIRLRRGCYACGSWWIGLGHSARRRQLIFAHAQGTLTTSTGGSVYSHVSAARLHGLHLWAVDERIHLTQESCPSRISHGRDVVAHTRPLAPGDVMSKAGLRCTSLERTVLDCCLIFNNRQSLILMDHACRLGVDISILRDRCSALAGRSGVVSLRRALELADARSESAGESLTRELLFRLKIEPPVLQHVVRTPVGEHRLDFAWPARRVALEFDGKTKYFDYSPTGEVLFAERRREKALMEQGWTFIRIEWKDLFNEAAFKRRVLRALGGGAQVGAR